ncbi:hypothetical protein [Cellulophaga fucicola]|nr:hypothetical protein [Cellulophaga fucicola]
MKIKLMLLALILTVIGCKTDEPVKIANLSNLYGVDGFVDIPLTITNTQETDNYNTYTIRAIVDTDTIGMLVKLKKGIKAGFVNGEPKNMFIDQGVSFISMGEQSNMLLEFLAKKYEINSSNNKLKDTQEFTCANLNTQDIDYNKGTGKFKIFLEGKDDYAELFVNFDFAKNTINLNEKDNEYRAPLLRLLKK